MYQHPTTLTVYEELSAMYLQNKYTKWYNNIILQSQNRSTPVIYTEKHHIIPKSLGGSNAKTNIAILTAKEHFLCHLLLSKMTTGNAQFKMIKALTMIMGVKNIGDGRYIANSRWYAYAREHNIQNIKAHWTQERRLQHSKALKEYYSTVDKTSEKYINRIEKIREFQLTKVWTETAISSRTANCLKSAINRKGGTWNNNRRQSYNNNPIKMSPESNEKRRQAMQGRKTSAGSAKGHWFLSPDNEKVLFYPFKITANERTLSTYRLKKLIADSEYKYNGWTYISPATNDELKKVKYPPITIPLNI